jgi:hypothetical protein
MDVWDAASNGNLDVLKKYTGDWNARDDTLDDATILMHSVDAPRGLRLACVSYILSAGANPNACSPAYFITPLNYAVSRCDEEVVSILLKYGADPEIANVRNRTPLYMASKRRNPRIARLLLLHGAHASSAAKWHDKIELFADRRKAHRASLILLGIARFRVVGMRDIIRLIASWAAIKF